MDVDFEHQIRQRAYEIWVRTGMADGRDREHWLAAESEVAGASAPAALPLSAKPVRSKGTKSRRVKARK